MGPRAPLCQGSGRGVIRSLSAAARGPIPLVNLIGYLAVQVGDERRSLARDARRCDRMRADGVMSTETGMRPRTRPTPDAPTIVFMSDFLSKYARDSQLALRHS